MVAVSTMVLYLPRASNQDGEKSVATARYTILDSRQMFLSARECHLYSFMVFD